MKTETLYKCLPQDRKPNGFAWELGKWFSIVGKLEICKNGFHASESFFDAFRYVKPGWVAAVSVRGESQKSDDKQAWSEMKIERWAEWTRGDSVALAIYAAELVLPIFEKAFPDDDRPRKAIEAAKSGDQRTAAAATRAAYAAARAADAAALAPDADTKNKLHQFILNRKGLA